MHRNRKGAFKAKPLVTYDPESTAPASSSSSQTPVVTEEQQSLQSRLAMMEAGRNRTDIWPAIKERFQLAEEAGLTTGQAVEVVARHLMLVADRWCARSALITIVNATLRLTGQKIPRGQAAGSSYLLTLPSEVNLDMFGSVLATSTTLKLQGFGRKKLPSCTYRELASQLEMDLAARSLGTKRILTDKEGVFADAEVKPSLRMKAAFAAMNVIVLQRFSLETEEQVRNPVVLIKCRSGLFLLDIGDDSQGIDPSLVPVTSRDAFFCISATTDGGRLAIYTNAHARLDEGLIRAIADAAGIDLLFYPLIGEERRGAPTTWQFTTRPTDRAGGQQYHELSFVNIAGLLSSIGNRFGVSTALDVVGPLFDIDLGEYQRRNFEAQHSTGHQSEMTALREAFDQLPEQEFDDPLDRTLLLARLGKCFGPDRAFTIKAVAGLSNVAKEQDRSRQELSVSKGKTRSTEADESTDEKLSALSGVEVEDGDGKDDSELFGYNPVLEDSGRAALLELLEWVHPTKAPAIVTGRAPAVRQIAQTSILGFVTASPLQDARRREQDARRAAASALEALQIMLGEATEAISGLVLDDSE